MNRDTAERVAAFEGNISRRIFGGNKVNENWRKRYNKEIRQIVRDLDILHLSE